MAKPSAQPGQQTEADDAQAAAALQAAIDEVAFAIDDFLKLIPRTANRNEVDTYLRRSSINPITFPRHDADDTASTRLTASQRPS